MKKNYTRKISPWLGLLGLLGFVGFAGIPVYLEIGMTFPFLFFAFFGFFSFYYSGKMSDTLMDEMFVENRNKANEKGATFIKIMLGVMLVMIANTETHVKDKSIILILCEIVLALTYAGYMILVEYLTYKYDTCMKSSDEE